MGLSNSNLDQTLGGHHFPPADQGSVADGGEDVGGGGHVLDMIGFRMINDKLNEYVLKSLE